MLTTIERIDLFLRFAAIGQISLLATLLVVRRPLTTRTLLAMLSALCLVAYLLLTAPQGFGEIGHRGLNMSLTHSLPFFVWALSVDIFSARPGLFNRSTTLLFAIFAVLAVNLGVFWTADAPPLLHQASHWIALALLAHLLILAALGTPDDLVLARRRLRAGYLVFFAAQFLLIVLVEITDVGLGYPEVTNALNAAVFLVMLLVLGVAMAGPSGPALLDADEPTDISIDSKDKALFDRLMTFIDGGGYAKTGLSIRQLSDILNAPEHQLRRLINQGLGHRNFSTFLNTYRIDAACKRLEDKTEAHIPVLTIALDLGYGSIGPFNRAFKATTGKTPTEYRQFQNRP